MVLIKIKNGHILDGAGEQLGNDREGNSHTFWKSMGHMDIPIELAITLEKETPQRYEMVDRAFADKLLSKSQSSKNNNLDINSFLDKIEKLIDLNKAEQIALMNKLKIIPDKKGKEFDRIRKIILAGY